MFPIKGWKTPACKQLWHIRRTGVSCLLGEKGFWEKSGVLQRGREQHSGVRLRLRFCSTVVSVAKQLIHHFHVLDLLYQSEGMCVQCVCMTGITGRDRDNHTRCWGRGKKGLRKVHVRCLLHVLWALSPVSASQNCTDLVCVEDPKGHRCMCVVCPGLLDCECLAGKKE